jgi:hypothetical protein
MANSISFQLETGSDDLRGGNDNLNLVVVLRDGTEIRYDNVNQSQRWNNNTTHEVDKDLPETLSSFSDIIGVRLETTFGGGVAGDNSNLNALVVLTVIRLPSTYLFGESGDPLVRFTGAMRVHEFSIPSPALPLAAVIVTGSDDLRGGNDNLNLVVVLRDGAEIRYDNVNQSQRWADNSRHVVLRNMVGVLNDTDIIGVRLETTFGGGIAGDNWNLSEMTVSSRAALGGGLFPIFNERGFPLARFTRDRPVYYFERNR